ncbi:TonB-dependent receptor [Tenacibaculum caenipelagi]|uniref:TonB-dependent receptor-like protein n=1 Tax=Tenacibaculum caenipelagi TaxID=1325435 RepID=A0A4R6TFA1_9FLAO|nr:TonB-dependent receptor [Tenacibaculum caenipelagi]TDQ28917.1 TonB-dependent receptor-like protein [Tenacibaculum caenipelagi]
MRNFTITMLLLFSGLFSLNAQNIVRGIVINSDSENPMQGVSVSVKEANISSITDASGTFTLSGLPNGRQIVTVSLNGYETQNFPVELSGKTIDLGTIFMYEDISEDQDLSTITITDDELNDDTSAADNISGLLQASRDIYLRTAAFEWSGSFYRIRGLDSENGKVLINGIEMNKLYNSRPQWSNWGGLNDVLRNQEFSNGLTPSNYAFGGVLGSTNINTRASEYNEGGRISYASSNRSYSHRLMATYSSGLLANGWAIAVSGSRRAGNEGYVDGTFYDANSIFLSLEKQINDSHSLNLTVIAAENERGKSSPNTQEVFDIRGIRYNSYWGKQNGKMRNSRVKRLYEPIIMLNHYWKLSENTMLNTNIGYQFGEIGNSRLDYNGTNNPDPTYYRKLPSWYLSDPNGPDYENAYKALTNFQNDGQIDWDELYIGNEGSPENARAILYEDRNDDKQFTANMILSSELNENIILTANAEYRKLKSENFATPIDMLGAIGYLDVNTFGSNFDQQQSNLLTPNRTVGLGDSFKYNYIFESEVYGGFAQLQFKYNKVDFYVAGQANNTTHQREGLFQNGYFPTNSYGKSDKLDFFNYGAKGGLTYKISGRHLLDFNGGYLTKAPSLRNSFSNSRANNVTVADVAELNSEKILSGDISYIFRSPLITSKVTGYFTDIKDATEISFFFADGIGGDTSAFIQEILTGIDKRHFGVELGIEAQVTSTIKLKGAANIGQYTYNNNPNLVITTENASTPGFTNGKRDMGAASLKDYRIAAGPQKAYSFGFEYRDPDYWWFGATVNYLDEAFVDISPIRRTSNFVSDVDGAPFADYDPVLARKLLQQEQFNDYIVVNAIGGKSWKVGNGKYIGLFASINNLFNEEYKTGGYEQGRRANYRELRDDNANGTPTFGNKYWYGRGTTYFLNVNYRF